MLVAPPGTRTSSPVWTVRVVYDLSQNIGETYASHVTREGVILDSGGVLIRPKNGCWFPPPAFTDVLSEQGVAWAPDRLEPALVDGGDYLDEVHPLPLADENSERAVWVRYFEILLDRVALEIRELAEAIAARWESTMCVEPYP